MQDPNKLLKAAVDEIVHQINDEKLPAHAAVVKTARELDLNVHLIKRACEVLNVALTYEHFRKNAADRDADFPIVDAQKVSAEIFPDKELTLPEKKSHLFQGTMVEEEVPDFLKASSNKKFKEAYVHLMSQKDEVRGMSEQGICEKAGQARQNMIQHLDDCRTELVGAKLSVNNKFAALVNHWSKEASSRASFAEFESQAFSRLGEEAAPYVDLIYKAAGLKEFRGEHDTKYVAFDDCAELTSLSSLLKAASEVPPALAKLAEAAFDLANTDNLKNAAYRQLGEYRLQQLSETPDQSEELPASKVAAAPEDCEDPVMAMVLKKQAALQKEAAPGGSVPFSLFNAFTDQYKKESTPSPTNGSTGKLNNLDRKLLVQNLMATDPILRTYDPKKVGDSYEQFMRLAPELSTEKEIVRSHLRQMVASQSTSAFDASQLIESNSKLVKQRQLERGTVPAKDDK